MPSVTARLLLDEMLTDDVAAALRARGHDVRAVVADPTMVGLADASVLARATAEGRAVVTRNIKDFVNLDAQYRAGNSPHAGLVLVSTKTFPEDRHAVAALIRSLDALLTRGGLDPGSVVFLQR